LDAWIVFRIRYYREIGKGKLDCAASPAHDSATATALHAACSVTGARYRETGNTGLGGGMHCPSASSVKHKFEDEKKKMLSGLREI